MYADDTVLISETPEGLQDMLRALKQYTNEWKLHVNTDKTKILIFRNGARINNNERWLYDGTEIEVVNQFCYLGMLFNYNGKFLHTQKHIADQGRKALFAVFSKLNKFKFNIETQCAVFDSYVNSILSYGSEVWGFHKANDVEKLRTYFCKRILGVKKSTSNIMVYCELGRLPLYLTRKLKIIKFWLRLMKSNNCILTSCLSELISINDQWILNVKEELCKLGMKYIWDNIGNVCLNNNTFTIIKQRFNDMYHQELLSKLSSSPRSFLYQYYIDNFCLQYYLCKPILSVYRKQISCIRLSSHSLKIESGRYTNTQRNNRLCTCCNLNDIEDEFHFILKCPFYKDLRILYIKRFYYNKPSVFKLVKLLSINNVTELCKLGKFLKLSTDRRKTFLSQ